jgi:hypothetical protein
MGHPNVRPVARDPERVIPWGSRHVFDCGCHGLSAPLAPIVARSPSGQPPPSPDLL